jgi:N-methylhydantoinase A
MDEAMVPVHAGVLSALGMLAAPPGRLLTRTWLGPLAQRPEEAISAQLDELGRRARAELVREGHPEPALRVDASLDLRYIGQSYTLNAAWRGRAATEEGFHRLHELRYGHRLELPVELVNLRVRVTAPPPPLVLPSHRAASGAGAAVLVDAVGCPGPVPVLQRGQIPGDARPLTGPAIVVDPVATTWLAEGWTARLDRVGNLLLEKARRGS